MAWFHKRDTDNQPSMIRLELERHLSGHLSGVVQFNCPHCKHTTLAVTGPSPSWYITFTTTIYLEPVSPSGPDLQCIVCGKVYRKTSKPAYEEVIKEA